jgi:hypothetical protein
MPCCRVESLANPSVVVLATLFRGTLPGFLFAGECAKSAGAQGDAAVFGVSTLPPSGAAMIRHLIHVSGLYSNYLIIAIRFHLDRLDFVL